MNQAEKAFGKLLDHLRETALLQASMRLLSWDQETHMPPGGAEIRAGQLAQLAGLIQRRRRAAVLGRLLEESRPLAEGVPPDADVAVILREAQRDHDRAKRIPVRLAEQRARLRVLARRAWVEARAERDFARFRPWLDKVFKLMRRWADALGHDGNPYDALVDDYERGETARSLADLFAPLREALPALLGRIRDHGRPVDASPLSRLCPVDAQRGLARAACETVGFDFARGDLTDTVHPFCSGLSPEDVRITTRYRAEAFIDGFFSALHEAGHGMYEQGLPAGEFGTPLGQACSFGIHESQSRLFENLVGRSAGFWRHFFPRVRSAFAGVFDDVAAGDFHRAVNQVRPSFIRVDADEVTYNLHIFLRFDLEQAILAGDLKPRDLPGAWNERFAALFGLTPAHDAEGCLQDVHWGATLVGYFPTYTLGNIYAAQIYERARAELGDLDEGFARGEFAPLLRWLGEKIYRHGRRYPPAELAERVAGAPRSPAALVRHLEARAAETYGL